MTRRARTVWFGSATLLVLAGIAGAVASSGTLGQVLALVLIGLGLVLVTALVFYEVGLSEDKERARSLARKPDRGGAPHRGGSRSLRAPRPYKPHLGRLRGSRRRLR